jgi:tetrapyrrole methylase family protein/MazG family protein
VSRGRVVVVGLGPADASFLTARVSALLEGASPVRLRTSQHPAADELGPLASFDHLYDDAASFDEVYERIVEELAALAQDQGEVVYAVPGSPLVAERSVELLRDRDDLELEIIPSLSFVDLAWAALGLDPLTTQVRLVDATSLTGRLRGPGPILLTQCHSARVLSSIKLSIDEDLLDEPLSVTVLHHLGLDDELVEEVPLDELDRLDAVDHLTSVYIRELRTVGPAAEDLVDLMARLRAECPWDQKQTHGSLTRHLLEEAYEALDALEDLAVALESGEGLDEAYVHAEEELGDLVFQAVFHAHLAAEEGRFDLTGVLDGVRTKLIGRHPHVFGDVVAETPDDVASNWEEIKRAEKGRQSVTDGIPDALPSLMRYVKLQRKAAALGLPSATPGELRSSVRSQLALLEELEVTATDDAVGSSEGSAAGAVAEALASLAELAWLQGVDPELALRRHADELRASIVAQETAAGA